MQKLYDGLFLAGFFGLLLVGGWTGPLWGMMLAGAGSLGLMIIGAWLGGYIITNKKGGGRK